jgi:hypothetical protein
VSRYILIRRLRGPAFLLLLGVNALLAEAHILGWWQSWPLYLILGGVLLLAERAALSAEGYPTYPGASFATNPQSGAQTEQGSASTGTVETALVPRRHQGFDDDPNGGQQ